MSIKIDTFTNPWEMLYSLDEEEHLQQIAEQFWAEKEGFVSND